MSISEADFYGGASVVTATTNLHPNSSRVQACWNGSSINLNLPLVIDWKPGQRGGPMFYIVKRGAGNVVVKVGGSTLATLTASGTVACVLLSDSGYFIRLKTAGTARTIHHRTRDPVANPEVPNRYSESCFEGTLCDLAVDQGLEPLDGEEGRDKCIVPMCQDVVAVCLNASREPIRAADVVMPSIIPVQFYRDQFAADAAHPLAATVLPEQFYESLYNNDRPHALEYVGPLNGTSRHPHHLRWEGVDPTYAWNHGDAVADFVVKRHLWAKALTYTLDDEVTTFTIDLRFVVEHTLTSEPGVDPSVTPGGIQDRDRGAWGTLFTLYVFARQLSPSFVDGGTYTPVGASGPVAFSNADPFASGVAYGVGELAEDKFCHPQLVLVAHLPTTFQSPMGSSYIPWDERRYLKQWKGDYDLRGKNQVFCHKLRNGSPWVDTTSCEEQYPRDTIGVDDIQGNIVFGWTSGTVVGASMSLGGGFPSSKPTEFLVWENGGGAGRTYLRPTKPGWDEVGCGNLDVPGGSSGGIAICTEDPYGPDDGSGRREWPKYDFVECDGHPDEPFEGVGGGHQCFNNGNSYDTGALVSCCIDTTVQAFAFTTDICTITGVEFGDFNGVDCDLGASRCDVASYGRNQAVMEYSDHSYLMNGNQALRSLTWVRYLPDPARLFSDYAHAGTAGNKMVSRFGTWNFSLAAISVTGVSSASNVKALAVYDEPSNPVTTDVIITASVTDAQTITYGLAARTSYAGSVLDGYVAVLDYTSGTTGTASIRKYVNDVETILGTVAVGNFSSPIVELEFDVWGAELTFRWTIDGEEQAELVAFDCELTSGEAGLAVMEVASGGFDSVNFDDETKEFLSIDGVHGRYLNSITWPEEIPTSRIEYIQGCDAMSTGGTCGDCCSPPHCNCTILSSNSWTYETTIWDGVNFDYPDGRDTFVQACTGGPASGTYSGNGENPTNYSGPFYRCDCAGDFCPGGSTPCGDCPPPWRSIGLSLPSCWPGTQEADEPRMCEGVVFWGEQGVACF